MTNVSARLARVRDGLTPREWARTGAMIFTVVALNVTGWVLLALAVGGHYHIANNEIFGFGTGALAYTLGMRHAFDADHIAAIDNTTRKLVNEGKRPLERRVLLLTRPLHDRVRPGAAAQPGHQAASTTR